MVPYLAEGLEQEQRAAYAAPQAVGVLSGIWRQFVDIEWLTAPARVVLDQSRGLYGDGETSEAVARYVSGSRRFSSVPVGNGGNVSVGTSEDPLASLPMHERHEARGP